MFCIRRRASDDDRVVDWLCLAVRNSRRHVVLSRHGGMMSVEESRCYPKLTEQNSEEPTSYVIHIVLSIGIFEQPY